MVGGSRGGLVARRGQALQAAATCRERLAKQRIRATKQLELCLEIVDDL